MEKRTNVASGKGKVVSDKYGVAKRENGSKNNNEVSENEKKIKPTSSKKELVVKVEEKKNEEYSPIKPQEIPLDDLISNDGNPELDANPKEVGPPETEDGEVLRKSRKADSLGLASGIMGYTALGLLLITGLLIFILWIVFYVGLISWALVSIIAQFLYYGSMALGIAALVTGAISYARGENGMALAGIIIGAILLLLLIITLIAVLV